MMGPTMGQEPCQIAECGQNLSGIGMTDLTAVLIIGAITHMMGAIFDGPVIACDREQAGGIGCWILKWLQRCDEEALLFAEGSELDQVSRSLDSYDLTCAIKPNLIREDSLRPQSTGFQTPMLLPSRFSLSGRCRGEMRQQAGVRPFPECWVGYL